MKEWYKEDLAYIHDVGHSDFALKSAPGILEIFTQNKVCNGLVVDLGCGSGLWAQELSKAHYHVLGVDISEALIAIARTRVPDAEFRVESLFKTDIPPCNAVTSIGECLNYLFDPDNNWQMLIQLFLRVYSALTPDGVFVFDIAEPGQVLPENVTKGFSQGEDWVVLVEKEENRNLQTLTRRITSFRKIGKYYRQADEIHHLQLYKSIDIARELCRLGFQVSRMSSYGSYYLPKAHTAFVAHKIV
ncbi:class I SAM-dependent methyltransferase [Chlorogloeopsis sp. ULAP02]|uniref:class I SAM-dependent methyltransferase n=1 Tax=Chlorogloeopsis sp. ULAP02 TaxID=3107926 RepID=UPI0031357CE2